MDWQIRDIISTRSYRIKAPNRKDKKLIFNHNFLASLDSRLSRLLSKPFVITGSADPRWALLISQRKWEEWRPLIERMPSMNKPARRIQERMLNSDRLFEPNQFVEIPHSFFDTDYIVDQLKIVVISKEHAQIWQS